MSRKLVVVGVLAGLLMTAAACGGQTPPPPSQPAQAGGAAAAKTSAPLEVALYPTIAPGAYTPYDLVWAVMVAKPSFFADAGLKPDTSTVRMDQVPALLASGRGGIVISTGIATLTGAWLRQHDSKLRVIAGMGTKPSYFMVTQPGITAVAQLKGKTVGIPGLNTAAADEARAALAANGLKYPGDYSFLQVGTSGERLAALQSKSIDAEPDTAPSTYVAESLGFKVLFDLAQYAPSYSEGAIGIDEGWAQKNREAVVRFLEAYVKAAQWTKDPANKDQVIKLFADNVKIGGKSIGPEQGARLYADTVTKDKLAWDGFIPEAVVQGNYAAMEQGGLITKQTAPPYSAIFDWSYLTEALKRLNLPVPPTY